MATYSKEQVAEYLNYVGVAPEHHAVPPSLPHLSTLVVHQLATVPFENLSLHYSRSHRLSLDLEDLNQKIVGHGRGGYCMENNAFFGTMLRTLGYTVIGVGGRVSDATAGRSGDGFTGLSHMVNLVSIAGQRYLVDVGFGSNNPCRPIPLTSGAVVNGIGPQKLRLEYKTLSMHTDKTQKVWVYAHRANDEAVWEEGYCFTEVEFFRADFEVMNWQTMTLPGSFFVQNVMCVSVFLDEMGEPDGTVSLFNRKLTRRVKGTVANEMEFATEQERIEALERYFHIRLSEEQRVGIVGLSSQITMPGES